VDFFLCPLSIGATNLNKIKQPKLYTELAYLYDAIYQTFIDYDEEFKLYKNFMYKYEAHSVLEIGCGSGHLAKRFNTVGYDYEGFDLSQNMLNIAQKRVPPYTNLILSDNFTVLVWKSIY
jgi:predicted TPR repeat methyltransferase